MNHLTYHDRREHVQPDHVLSDPLLDKMNIGADKDHYWHNGKNFGNTARVATRDVFCPGQCVAHSGDKTGLYWNHKRLHVEESL